MGEIDLAGILILELFQAAARAAVTQALPFGVGHLFQRLGFPEESLLARRTFGCGCHGSQGFPVALVGARPTLRPNTALGPSRGYRGSGASGAFGDPPLH